jgi:putative transposase
MGCFAGSHALRLDIAAGDDDFSNRWKAIKIRFVQKLPRTERRSQVRVAKGERGVWQRRFWEHVIRDDIDYARHVDYVHWNPMKHGLVQQLANWPYSSFHRYVRNGLYSADWAGGFEYELDGNERSQNNPYDETLNPI